MTNMGSNHLDGSRIVTVCMECGLVDEDRTNPSSNVESHDMIHSDPAYRHHDRTGHAVRSFSVKDAPTDIQGMVSEGDLSGAELDRINEWVLGQLWGSSDEEVSLD